MWISCICGTSNLSRIVVSLNNVYRLFRRAKVEIAFFLEWFFFYSGMHDRMGGNDNNRGGGGRRGGGGGINRGEIYTRGICCILDGLLQSIYFSMFGSKHSINFESIYLLSCWFHCVVIFCIKFRICGIFTVIRHILHQI